MASSTLTADRRWASSRKSGMTVLGKVPKPINLPSQRLENHGLDPNVEIVPKGTITWGNRPTSSSNAWNSSSILSPKTEASASSSPDLMGRPGSSGSSTRPSTGNTDRLLGPDPSHAWGPNSRPSSASGSFASGHLSSPNRPRSADTRPGSSHLSRFAESSGESKGFTLSSGDFPTLGSEKPAEPCRGHSSHGRPTSGMGRDARPKEAIDTLSPGHDSQVRPTSGSGEDNMTNAPNSGDFPKTTDGPQTQSVNILMTDDPSNTNWYAETPYQYPTHQYRQPHPNQPNIVLPVPPPQYDTSWRGPPPQPMQQTPEGAVWYPPGPHAPAPHGPGPYRPSGPPNNYPIDPFVYYPPPPHFRPPNAESAPRPHMPPPHNPYMMPAHPVSIPGRPGPHAPYAPVPPVSYEGGYYGPSRAGFFGIRGHNHNNNRSNYNNSNNNQQAILNQGQNQSPRSSVTGSDAAPKQYVLLKHREEEKKDEKQPELTVMNRGKDHSAELSENQQQPIVRKNTALIQKIEELNNKARSLESSHSEIKEEKPRPGEGILGTPSGVSEAGGMSSFPRTGEEVTAVRQHHAERRSNEQRRMRQRPGQVPHQVVPVKNEALLDNTATAGFDKVLSLQKEGDTGLVSDSNLPPSDPAEYEIQRALLKEKAAQRAKELQREEEERIREQKAKALAKLEELNRRATPQKEPVHRESDPSPLVSDSHLQQEPSDVIIADKHLQEVPLKSAEISGVATVTLSFGTISEVQITTGQVTHISEVPISSMKTIADAGAIAGVLGTGSGANTGTGGVVGDGTGTSSHARHHNGKQMGYKKRHNSNLNASPELRTADKMTNVGAVSENPTEPAKQTDAQVSVSESTQHKDDTIAHHRKKGNRNPKSRSKTEVMMPASVPVQSVAPGEGRPVKGLNEKIESISSTAPTSENPNSVPPEDSGKEVSKPLEVELRAGGGSNRVGPHWKAQQQRRPVRNHRTISDKSHSNETVMWAPVKHPKEENTHALDTGATVAAVKNDGEVHTGVKTKRAEIERYVPKPQLSRLEKKPDESTDIKPGEILSPPEAKTGEVDTRTINSGNSTNNFNKSTRRGGKPHTSWRQRVGPVEMHEAMFHNPTDGEKTLASDTQLVMPSPAPKDYEESNPDGRPRRHNGHKLYKATGSNYIGHGATRSEIENISVIVDGTITGMEGKSENMESGSGEVLNYNTNTRSQHWKPKSQSHGRGNVGWQKVVSDKAEPISDKCQDEDKPVTCNAPEDSGSADPRHQRGNARQYKSGTSEEREIDRDFQPVTGSYQRVNGEDGMEGGNRGATGSRYRGRGRNGHFVRRPSE
ncbi:protein MODIFIER OF SNC1 1 [Carex littledalei]|uniref:Protein MODIFIER OF SNC1 1 n=1 Tax=Carex littledalei TaxID=544730 RepID=A0A833VD17_9POAL|nr:protein MODIFIER OF SNC1 1 [Carex littledalei]